MKKRKKRVKPRKKNIKFKKKKLIKKSLNLHFSFDIIYWLSFIILSLFFFYKEMYYWVLGCCVIFLSFFIFGKNLLNLKKKVKIEKKKVIKYKEPLEIVGIICLLLIIYFAYNSRSIFLELLKEKEILYYVGGGILIGMIVIFFIKFRKKIKLPKFKFKEKQIIEDKKSIRITKSSIPLKEYETYFDKLYDWVNEKGSIDIDDVTKKFGISRDNAERWGKILEAHGLIKLHYHGFNKINFKKW
ncbi:MAG: hypothetical protein KJ674_03715 [Nanoarchaeota archaeon]|nr:hypothetical protein [Nanoarchaeota archaeon]